MYNDDFYAELAEFEMLVDEFKEALLKSVKQEYQDELEALRKENAELQEFKVAKDKIQREHAEALRDMKYEQKEALRNIKQMRLTELLGENMLTGWFAAYNDEYPPKCDKCGKDRLLHFTSPSGKQLTERCPTCGSPTMIYYPEEIECYELSQRQRSRYNDPPGVGMYFRRKEENDCDTFESFRHAYKGEPFEKVERYNVVFFKEEECRKFCEWLNNKT